MPRGGHDEDWLVKIEQRVAALEQGGVTGLQSAFEDRKGLKGEIDALRDQLLDFRNESRGNVEGAFEDRARLQARIAALEEAGDGLPDKLALRIAELITGLAALESRMPDGDATVMEHINVLRHAHAGRMDGLDERVRDMEQHFADHSRLHVAAAEPPAGPAVTNDRMVALERRVNDLHNDRAEHDHRITAIEEHLTAPSPDTRDAVIDTLRIRIDEEHRAGLALKRRLDTLIGGGIARLMRRVTKLEDASLPPAARDAVADTLRSAGFDAEEWMEKEARNACVMSGQCFDAAPVVPGGASVERMGAPRDAGERWWERDDANERYGEAVARSYAAQARSSTVERRTVTPDVGGSSPPAPATHSGQLNAAEPCDPETCNDAEHWLSPEALEEGTAVGKIALPWRSVGPNFREATRLHVSNLIAERLKYGARKRAGGRPAGSARTAAAAP